MNQTHVAASQLSVSSSTDHVAGDQAAPPVVLGAGVVVDHGEEGLLQDFSNGTSSFRREHSDSGLQSRPPYSKPSLL